MSVDPDFTSWQRKRPQPMLRHLSALTALTCTGEGLFAVQAHEVSQQTHCIGSHGCVTLCLLAGARKTVRSSCSFHRPLPQQPVRSSPFGPPLCSPPPPPLTFSLLKLC